jgi:hypothetical protein
MKRRTLRGTVEDNNEVRRLVVDDGNTNHGYKVVKFYILSINPQTSTGDAVGTLSKQFDGARTWTLGDNRQIAWAGHTMIGSGAPDAVMSVVDPDHVILGDLYVWGTGTGTTPGYQYMVELETMDLNNDEAVLQLIKERSQDVN